MDRRGIRSGVGYRVMNVTYEGGLRFDRGWLYYIRAVAHGRVVGGVTYALPQRRTASLRTLRQAIAAAFPRAANRDAAWVASKYGNGWDTASTPGNTTGETK